MGRHTESWGRFLPVLESGLARLTEWLFRRTRQEHQHHESARTPPRWVELFACRTPLAAGYISGRAVGRQAV